MSIISQNVYTVQVDSNYRDLSKYPLSTDFSVRFKTNNQTGPEVNGLPYNNGFQLPCQIDPDFVRADFRSINGQIQHSYKDANDNFYISGLMYFKDASSSFSIYQGNYRILVVGQDSPGPERTLPFVGKFTPLGNFYYVSWFNYAWGNMNCTRSTFDIDINDTVFWLFDAQSETTFNVLPYSNPNNPFYTILTPQDYSEVLNGAIFNVICAFTTQGSEYTLNGVPWGYHILSSDKDIFPTLENGRSYVKTDSALSVYTTCNTNPYSPKVYEAITDTNECFPADTFAFKRPSTGDTFVFQFNCPKNGYSTPYFALYVYDENSSTKFTLHSTYSDLGLPASSLGYYPINFIDTGDNVFILCANRVADSSLGRVYVLPFYKGVTLFGPMYNQYLGYDTIGGPGSVGTTSAINSCLNMFGTRIWVTLDNTQSSGSPTQPAGVLTYYIDLDNIPGGFTFVNHDSSFFGYSGETTSILSVENYIISAIQGIDTVNGNGLKLYRWNNDTLASASQFYTQLGTSPGGPTFNVGITVGKPLLFMYSGIAYPLCFVSYSYGGCIFGVGYTIDAFYPTQNVYSVVYAYGTNSTIVIQTISNKYYLMSTSSGLLYDITDLNYPYLVTDSYPKENRKNIQEGTNTLSQVISFPSGNVVFGGNYNSNTSQNKVISCSFIDTPTSVKSKHYSKPILQFTPQVTGVIGSERQTWELFTIPGSETNVSTNFSPAQFVNNGLVAWYKPSAKSNLVLEENYVKGMLDLSGNGLDLYTNANLPECPQWTENDSYIPAGGPSVLWTDISTPQIASYSSSGSWTQSSIKFVMMTYSIVGRGGPIGGTPNILPFQAVDGSTVYIQSNYTGVYMRYQEGLAFGYNPDYPALTIGADVVTYFGYNKDSTLPPFVANGSIGPKGVPINYTPLTTSVNQIRLMENIQGLSNYAISLREIVILDFIPSDYQLSLFQYYFNSQLTIFPVVIPPLAGVYSLYTNPPGGNPSIINIERVDGSTIQNIEYLPLITNFSDPTVYVDIKYIRSGSYNLFTTIATDNYIRTYRFNDYLQLENYGEYDIPFGTEIGYPSWIIQPYINANGVTRFVVSTLSNTVSGEDNSAYLMLFAENFFQYTIDTGYARDQIINLAVQPVPNLIEQPSSPVSILSTQVYTYDDGKSMVFAHVATTQYGDTSSDTYNTLGSSIQLWDVTDDTLTLFASYPAGNVPNTPTQYGSTNRYSSNIIKYPNGNIYLLYTIIPTDTPCIILDITDYNQVKIVTNAQAGVHQNGVIGEDAYINLRNTNNAAPRSMFIHPVTNRVYSIDSSTLYNVTNDDYIGNINVYDYTNLNSIPSSYTINQQFYAYNPYSSSYELFDCRFTTPTNIKSTIWNQKVWAMANLMDYSGNYKGTVYLNLSNVEYFAVNYTDNQYSSLIYDQTYSNIEGIGVGLIHKLDANGSPNWLSLLGGRITSDTKLSLNTTISNITLDSSLKYCYIAGGWQNKIESFVDTDVITGQPLVSPIAYNKITTNPTDTSINSFVCKLNINDGTFVWLSPTFGKGDDYYQRIMYNPTTTCVSLIGYFSSPVMLVYEPQLSVNGAAGLTNPINTILNVSNPSTFTTVLFTIDEECKLKWSTKLYSLEQASKNKGYDLTIDGGSIHCILLSNSNKLECIDSTGKNVQNTYTNISPLSQQFIAIYAFDYNGIYQKSERIEMPPGFTTSIYDLVAFNVLNRMLFFANFYTTINASNNSIRIYNKDGSYATGISEYPIGIPFSQAFEYKFNSSFIDTNGKEYSQIILSTGTSSETVNLQNYKLFIQGGTQEFDPLNITTTYLNTDPYLNTNFSIRSNTDSTIILNSVVPTNKMIRKNLPSSGLQWYSSISSTPLYGIFSYSAVESVPGLYNITQLFGPPPKLVSSTGIYYVMYPEANGGVTILNVQSIVINRGIYQIQLSSGISGLNTISPFVYLGTYNQSANWTLQFYPASINTEVFFEITLVSLTIPDRPIKNSEYPGVRYINDFPYIYLMVINTNEAGTIDTQILNDFFTTNINRNPNAIFTLSGLSGDTPTNYTTLAGGLTAKIKFSPGFYRIRFVLFDPEGNIIEFDNTPIKQSDSIFSSGVVPDKLMNMVAVFTLKRTT